MSKNTGRSYRTKKINSLLKALNSMTLETTLDWLYRASFALKDKEPLSLKQYLIETKEVIKADERMKEIEKDIKIMTTEERDRRSLILDEEKGQGVGQFIL